MLYLQPLFCVKCLNCKSVYYVITRMFSYFVVRRAIRFWTTETQSGLGESEVFHVYSLGIVFGVGGSLEGTTGSFRV